MATATTEISITDIDYLTHGDRALKMRLFRPQSDAPLAVIVDVHGGAWNTGSLDGCRDRDMALAEAGFAVAAIDFRQAADGYPTSLQDINYAVRFLKARAGEFGIDSGRVGYSGQSSGGHLAMLAAMRPRDSRYAAIPLADVGENDGIDATVRCVGMLWPVINPLSRYRNALRKRNSDDPPAWVGDIPERHDIYWGDETAMREGNPVTILEEGEPAETPPALWVQGRPDPVHDYHDPESGGDLNEPERFAGLYRAAGGDIDIVDIEQAAKTTETTVGPLIDFYRAHLG